MNKFQLLDQVRSIVASELNQNTKIRKNFQSFFIETMILILTVYGKLNFLSISRHGDSCESRFRQNFRRKFDWCAFNSGMLLDADGPRAAIALDHSFIPKSGKKTPGLGRYWSGCAGTVFEDLNTQSLQTYRRRIKDYNPDFRYNDLDDEQFCIKTGILSRGKLTYGGLLMLGKGEVVQEYMPRNGVHSFVIMV